MKLYSFFNSSTSYRVRIALALKGIDYQYQGVNIRVGEQSSPDYLTLNAAQGVPVLVSHDNFVLTQSLAILHYLDERFGGPQLMPHTPEQKAQVLEFACTIACDIHPINNLKVLKYLSDVLMVSTEQKNTWYQHWIAQGLTAAEALLNKQPAHPFCFGDEPSLADVCLVPQWANAERFGCDLSHYPRLLAVYEHCNTHPAFLAAQPHRQPDFVA